MQGDLVLVDEAPPVQAAMDGDQGKDRARIDATQSNRGGDLSLRTARAGAASADSAASEGHSFPATYVTPLDERVGSMIAIPDGAEVITPSIDSPHRMLGDEARVPQTWEVKDRNRPLEGLAVDVEITDFPAPGRPARGRVIEVLGPPDAFGVDVEIVIRKHHIPHTFPANVLAEAAERAQETVATLTAEELAPSARIFAGCRLSLSMARRRGILTMRCWVSRPLPNGNTELQVHIADVGWYVRPGSALDTEARVRGTSVYFPDRAVPMLPHALSSGMCSLLPNEDRLALSCIMEIDTHGEIVGYYVAEGLIRSVMRMTYTNVQHCINASPKAAAWNEKQLLRE